MNIILVDRKPDLISAWKEAFAGRPDVTVTSDDILTLACDAIVSPANSFGFMDGGLDNLLSNFFGWHVQERLQSIIRSRPLQELLVGEALVVPTDHPKIPWLISAPTMRVPMVVTQSINAYLAMKAVLISARDHAGVPLIRSVVVPGLATGIGRIKATTAARQMFAAYEEVILGVQRFPANFGDAQRAYRRLNPDANLSED